MGRPGMTTEMFGFRSYETEIDMFVYHAHIVKHRFFPLALSYQLHLLMSEVAIVYHFLKWL